MTFDDLIDPELGGYQVPDGCYYELAEDYLLCEVLDFCCCGKPEASLTYVRDGLRLIEERRTLVWTNKRSWEDHRKLEDALHGGERQTEFFHQFVNSKDLCEHGGSVPGWLTPKGYNFIADVDELYADSTNT